LQKPYKLAKLLRSHRFQELGMTRPRSAKVLYGLGLAVPLLTGLAPDAGAARAGQEAARAGVVLKQMGEQLFFSEAGGPFLPVPDGPAAAVLRDLARDAGAPLRLEVGRTMVADGASGWHGENKKP
jgi:hypothetical protein